MSKKFPEGFLWGAATASHQIEGGLINNWVKWEEKNATRLSRDGQRPSNEALKEVACDPENYKSNSSYSCDSYKYWERDIEAIKKLNLKAYRLSVEWSRIQPERGVFDSKEIEYYRKYLKALRDNNIKIVLTCWHWTIPVWLDEEGGLLSKNIYKYFNEYVSFLAKELGKYVDYWIVINEPESFAASYLLGMWPPGIKNPFLFHKVFKKVLPKMYIDSYKTIKDIDKGSKVSLAKNVWHVSSCSRAPWNRFVAFLFDRYMTVSIMDQVVKYTDFLGINFYFHNRLGIRGLRNDNDIISDLGWWLDPGKIFNVLVKIKERYNKPIFITENGLATLDDNKRIWWIEETVKAMDKAIKEESVELMGYLHWSLLDNFEWDKGFWPKFGLVSVDPQTKERRIKRSGEFYSKIIKENGII